MRTALLTLASTACLACSTPPPAEDVGRVTDAPVADASWGRPDVPRDVPSDTSASDAPIDLVLTPARQTVIEGSRGTVRVTLSRSPPSDVTATVSATSGLAVVPSTVVFDRINWDEGVPLEVSVPHDGDAAHGTAELMAIGPGLAGAGATIDITDDDTLALVVSPLTVRLTEGATSENVLVSLTHPPVTPIDVGLATDLDSLDIAPATLRFTAADYAMPQRVTLSPRVDADDADDAGPVHVTAPGLATVDIGATVAEPTPPRILVSVDRLTFVEGAPAVVVDVRLDRDAGGTVLVDVRSSLSPWVTAGPVLLGLTGTTPRSINVTAWHDIDVDDDVGTIELTAAGVSPATITVSVSDPGTPLGVLVAGWDFSQYATEGLCTTDLLTGADVLPANYSALDLTNNAGAEAAAFGAMFYDGTHGSSDVDVLAAAPELLPSAGSLTDNIAAPVVGPGFNPFDALTVLTAEGQVFAQLMSVVSARPVRIVFRADLTSAPFVGRDWEVSFAARMSIGGPATMTVEHSLDGITWSPAGTEPVGPTSRPYRIPLSSADAAVMYVRLDLPSSATTAFQIDNVGVHATLHRP